MLNFKNLVKLKKIELFVINKFTHNEEFYIFLNKRNCRAITLEGFPLRIENTDQYIVYNNPSTDKAWKIQILKIENGNISLKDEIIFPNEIRPKKVLRLEQNEIFILDDIHWSKEMEEAWNQVKQHPAVTLTIDLFFIGIVCINTNIKTRQHFVIRF